MGKADPWAWPGWPAALEQELQGAGGSVHWRRLRDALVAHYLQSQAPALDDTVLGHCALACIPEAYLSNDDCYVRLPSARGSKRSAIGIDCDDNGKKTKGTAKVKNCQEGPEGVGHRVASTSFRVHVGGLLFSLDEGAIQKHFEKCGIVLNVELLKLKDGKSRGIAFVEFETSLGLDAALQLDGDECGGRELKISKAQSAGKREGTEASKGKGKGNEKGKRKDRDADSKGKGKSKEKGDSSVPHSSEREFEVFIGGLPFGTSQEQIKKDFEAMGETNRFHLPLNEEGGHTGIAFVNYVTREAMEKALEFDSTEYGGVWIRVQRAGIDRSKGKGKGKESSA